MRKQLDFFGVVVIAVVASLGGGMIRDVLIGAVPPAALQDWRYLLVPLPAAFVAFRRSDHVVRAAGPLLLVDALGLGLFGVAGARKALDSGMSAIASVGIGVITAVGGGLIRDVMLGEIPARYAQASPTDLPRCSAHVWWCSPTALLCLNLGLRLLVRRSRSPGGWLPSVGNGKQHQQIHHRHLRRRRKGHRKALLRVRFQCETQRVDR